MANSNYFSNPFRAYRAEQLDSVWKFYVKEPFNRYLGPKPLIFEGGRGSGKTMFYLCNSWQQKFSEKGADCSALRILVQPDSFVGFYYRADATFIGGFYGKGVDDAKWNAVFATYFNIVICKEMLFFLSECLRCKLVDENEVISVLRQIDKKLNHVTEKVEISLSVDKLNASLDEIENFVNDTTKEVSILLNSGSLIRACADSLRSLPALKDVNFQIFIDEYETLSINQQIQLNTLIKMSVHWLVYCIAVKNKGMKTYETLSGEIIQHPHDYRYFNPESELSDAQNQNLLVEICKKRFEQIIIGKTGKNVPTDIRFYLGEYSSESELKRLECIPEAHIFKDRIKELISTQISDPQKRELYYRDLAEGDLIPSRMHLCLLLRKDSSVEQLHNELILYRQGQSKKYGEWLHNMSFAVIFLLCKEANIRKEYYGFSVFAMLTSGIVRYFLELCEYTFDFAHTNGFSFDNPRSITSEEQSKAALYVSKYKISDIAWFKPNGKILSLFVNVLGGIFSELHSNKDATLGEPERNHFHTNIGELDEATGKILESALMHNVLQSRLPTKEKERFTSTETEDYFLNHIYCPYFNISYRKQRKVYISAEDLKSLLSGNASSARTTARQLLESRRIVLQNENSNQMEFFSKP